MNEKVIIENLRIITNNNKEIILIIETVIIDKKLENNQHKYKNDKLHFLWREMNRGK